MNIITREDAKIKGLKRYFTGNPCKYGHVAERLIINYACITCSELKYPEKAIKTARWRKKNPKKVKEGKIKYYIKNRTKILKKAEENYDPIKKKAYQEDYYKNNKKKFITYESNRRAKKLKAAVKWANKVFIEEVYNNCNKGMHVDHIIPLQGRLVCGLHVENNLQYLSKEENSKKRNRFIPYREVNGEIVEYYGD